MPPNRSQKRAKSTEQEGRILLAIKAIKNQEIHSIREAACRFNVPRSTLYDRLNGRQFSIETRANSHKLTATEEQTLTEWILSIDTRGNPPRVNMVREMANLLLGGRGINPPPSVGRN